MKEKTKGSCPICQNQCDVDILDRLVDTKQGFSCKKCGDFILPVKIAIFLGNIDEYNLYKAAGLYDDTYDRTKIEHGVLLACHKRPIPAERITSLVDEVETEIFNIGEREIQSSVIGELVMKKLKDLEAVA